MLVLGICLKVYEQVIFSALSMKILPVSEVWKLPFAHTIGTNHCRTLYKLSFGGFLMLIPEFGLMFKNDFQLTFSGMMVLSIIILFTPHLVAVVIRIVMVIMFYIEQIPKWIFMAIFNHVRKKAVI